MRFHQWQHRDVDIHTQLPRRTSPCEGLKRDKGGQDGEKNADFQSINRYMSKMTKNKHIISIMKD